MPPFLQMVLTAICAVLASSGFWAWMSSRRDKKDAKTKMILGLGHDRIITLSMQYIERGWITQDEYEDLNKYLYLPYQEMGGNGTAERLMNEVKKLPIHYISYAQQAKENGKNDQEPD